MSSPVIRRTPLHHATVLGAQELTPRMRRITLHAPTLEQPRPAQDVELVLVDDTGRRVKRRYTIRHFRAEPREIDVDALLHGHGPGARWAATADPGDAIDFFGPRGRLELTDAAWHLFAGDESAVPAIASLAEALTAPVHALIEVGDATDELPVPAEVRWLHRGERQAGQAHLLGAAIDAFEPPPGDGHGYLLGESRVVAALRAQLQAKGLDQLYVKGYWNVGRTPAPSGARPGQE